MSEDREVELSVVKGKRVRLQRIVENERITVKAARAKGVVVDIERIAKSMIEWLTV